MLNSKHLITLLVTLILALSLAHPSEANEFNGVHRRGHGSLKRLIRKRQLLPPFGGPDRTPVGVGADPADIDEEDLPGSVSESSVSETETSASSIESETESETESGSSTASEESSTESLSSSSESSSSETSTTEEPATETTPTPSPSPDQQQPPPEVTPNPEEEEPLPNETQTRTTFVDAEPTPGAQVSGNSKDENSGGTPISLTILIAVVSAAVGVTLLWTIFRKWKLARSAKFDKRLEPIDWAPSGPDDGIVPANRRHSGASSFRSGSGHGNGSDLNHDFTAGGASHLAPVGGYADLSRGPSPQPQMNEALRRGPSLTSGPQYDQYGGVPLHHQTGYGATRY